MGWYLIQTHLTPKELMNMTATYDALVAAIQALSPSVEALASKPGGTSDAALQPLVDQVNALKAKVDAAVAL